MENIFTSIGKFVCTIGSRSKLFYIQHKPQIMLATGIFGVVGGTVLACKATLEVKDVVDETKENLADIREKEAKNEITNEEKGKLITKEYASAAGKIALKYALPAGMITGGIVSFVECYKTEEKDKNLLGLKLAAQAAEFAQYRKRIADKYGEKEENDIYDNVDDSETVTEKVVNEDGTVEKKKVRKRYSKNPGHRYTALYSYGCRGFDKDVPYANMKFLRLQEDIFTAKLRMEHYVLLNDVLIALGFKPVEYGWDEGWLYDPKNPDKYSGLVKFGLDRPEALSFQRGDESSVWLTFNCDGLIRFDIHRLADGIDGMEVYHESEVA